MTQKLVLNSGDAAEFIHFTQMKMCTRFRDHLIEEGMASSEATASTAGHLPIFEILFKFETPKVEELINIDEIDGENTPHQFWQTTEAAIAIYERAIQRFSNNAKFAESFPVEHRIRVTQSYADHIISLTQRLVANSLVAALEKSGIQNKMAQASIDAHEIQRSFVFMTINEYVYRFFEIVTQAEEDAAYKETQAVIGNVCAAIEHLYMEVLRA